MLPIMALGKLNWSDLCRIMARKLAPDFGTIVVRNLTSYFLSLYWKVSNIPTYFGKHFLLTSAPDYDVQPLDYQSKCSKTGYLSFHDSCFRYDLAPRTFDEAVAFCQADGTSLATVRDGFEDALSVVLLYVHQLQDAWIGLRINSVRWLRVSHKVLKNNPFEYLN